MASRRGSDPRRDSILAVGDGFESIVDLLGSRYDVLVTRSVVEARRALVEKIPDVVLLDESCVDDDTFRLIEALAKERRAPAFLVVRVSADEGALTSQVPFTEIRRPFDGALITAIESTLRSRRA